MDKIEVVVESCFQEVFPAKALAEVHVETRDGITFNSGTMSARWEPSSGLPSDNELVEKFYWLAEPIVGMEKAKKIESMIWEFEVSGDVPGLIKSCIR